MLLFDAHLDLALNGVDLNRDLRQSVDDIRVQERVAGMESQLGRCTNTVSFPELRQAGVGVCLATLLARLEQSVADTFGHTTPEACYSFAHAHLAYYRAMEQAGWLRMLRTAEDLRQHVDRFNADSANRSLGIILTMEGADPLLVPETIEEFYQHGLRAIGLTHYGSNRYGGGTRSANGLAVEAINLLKHIERLGITVDMTHLSEKSFWQVADLFSGRVHASHQNSRRVSNWERQFSDAQTKLVIERDGIIGIACDAIMLEHGFTYGKSIPTATIDAVVQNIDIVCELAGDTEHVGIGTDLDGGYGNEQTPTDLKRYSDLPNILCSKLSARGYSDMAIAQVMHGNWLRFFGEVLP